MARIPLRRPTGPARWRRTGGQPVARSGTTCRRPVPASPHDAVWLPATANVAPGAIFTGGEFRFRGGGQAWCAGRTRNGLLRHGPSGGRALLRLLKHLASLVRNNDGRTYPLHPHSSPNHREEGSPSTPSQALTNWRI